MAFETIRAWRSWPWGCTPVRGHRARASREVFGGRTQELEDVRDRVWLDILCNWAPVGIVDIDDRVVDEVLANTWKIMDDRDVVFLQFLSRSNTRKEEQLRRVNGTSAV